jgi:hypothetical protein
MNMTEASTQRRFLFRLTCTLLLAVTFIGAFRIMSESVSRDTRILAGPVGLFRTQLFDDKLAGAVALALLLPCIFAFGVRRNWVTIILLILGLLCWVTAGILIEEIAAC